MHYLLIEENGNIITHSDNEMQLQLDKRWKITDTFFVFDHGYSVVTVESLPDNFNPVIYKYENGELVQTGELKEILSNEELSEIVPEVQKKVATHEDDISELYNYVADSIYKDCLGDLGLESEV